MAKRDTRRVKVYKLQSSGDWHDEGTGHVECVITDKQEAPCVVVKSEDDESVILLQTKISGEDIYNKQQETLIVWNESEPDEVEGVDLALSFQDKEGCSEIWEEICDIQQTLKSPGDDFLDLEKLFKLKDPEEFLTRSVILPPANLGHIDEIQNLLKEALYVGQKESVATAVVKEHYVQKLVDLWRIVDDLASEEDYVKMYHIFKDIVLLNSVPIIEQVVSPRFVIEIMSSFEHDPEHHIGTIKHSKFLKNQVTFKEVVPLNDTQLENKIHQTFHLQYLKDVALAKTLDEATFATINSIIYLNNIQIISELSRNEAVIVALFLKMKSLETTQQEMKEYLSFLSEMCDLSKNLEAKNKTRFYLFLYKNGLFEILEKTLVSNDVKLRLISAELLLNFVDHDANILRTEVTKQPDYPLFCLIILRLVEDPEIGIKILLSDVVRHACDVTNVDGVEKLAFLNVFYQHHANTLFSPLLRPLPKTGLHSEGEALLKNNLCEILSSFLHNHSPHIGNFLMNDSFIQNLLNLLHSKEKWLNLSAIRFFRAFVNTNNNLYCNYIIQHNLFEPVVTLFLKNAAKYNLVDSAILELFELVIKKNMKTIVKYLMENHYETLKNSSNTEIFQKLKEISGKNEFTPQTPELFTDNSTVPYGNTPRLKFRKIYAEERRDLWFDTEEDPEEECDGEYIPPEEEVGGEGTVDEGEEALVLFTSLQEFKEQRRKKRSRSEGEDLSVGVGDGVPEEDLPSLDVDGSDLTVGGIVTKKQKKGDKKYVKEKKTTKKERT